MGCLANSLLHLVVPVNYSKSSLIIPGHPLVNEQVQYIQLFFKLEFCLYKVYLLQCYLPYYFYLPLLNLIKIWAYISYFLFHFLAIHLILLFLLKGWYIIKLVFHHRQFEQLWVIMFQLGMLCPKPRFPPSANTCLSLTLVIFKQKCFNNIIPFDS